MKISKKLIKILVILIVLLFVLFVLRGSEDRWICDEAKGEWVKHGVPSAPMPDEVCGEEKKEKSYFIKVESPQEGNVIESPLVVKGEARGNWFFEGDFPIILTDWDGKIIAKGYATAQGKWIPQQSSGQVTENFIPFEGTIEFEKPEIIGDFSKRGSIIFQKDNPSNNRELDDALEITVYFE